MPGKWQKTALSTVRNLRDLALTFLIIGCAQILLSLIPWQIVFRSHPLGFSMALSLIGFGGWFIGFAASFGARRAPPGHALARQTSASDPSPGEERETAHPLVARLRACIGRSGCGFVLFLSSLLPLALAFVLRLQSDMRSGKTWNEIFPVMR
jgi:hypothetical protein